MSNFIEDRKNLISYLQENIIEGVEEGEIQALILAYTTLEGGIRVYRFWDESPNTKENGWTLLFGLLERAKALILQEYLEP